MKIFPIRDEQNVVYAIVKAGGHQDKVAVGDVVIIDMVEAEVGETLELEPVMIVDGETALVGSDKLKGKTVKVEVIGDAKGPKIRIIKYKNKTGYRKRLGHRQPLTVVEIKEIG